MTHCGKRNAPEQIEHAIHRLTKELRKTSSEISVRKIKQLDYSDQILLANKLRQVVNDLLYIQAVCAAKCSIVIEMYEHMGGTIPTTKGPTVMLTAENITQYHQAAKIIETDGCEGYFTCQERFGTDIAATALVTWLRAIYNKADSWPEPEDLIEKVNNIIRESGRMS